MTALEESKKTDRTTVIYIQNDRYEGVPGYESWWDVLSRKFTILPS